MTAHVPYTGLFQRTLREFARRLRTEADIDSILDRRRQLGRGQRAGRSRRAGWRRCSWILAIHPRPWRSTRCARPSRAPFTKSSGSRRARSRSWPRTSAYEEFLSVFRERLRAAAGRVVAFKSIIAYRSGLAIRAWTANQASRAYQAAVARVQSRRNLAPHRAAVARHARHDHA